MIEQSLDLEKITLAVTFDDIVIYSTETEKKFTTFLRRHKFFCRGISEGRKKFTFEGRGLCVVITTTRLSVTGGLVISSNVEDFFYRLLTIISEHECLFYNKVLYESSMFRLHKEKFELISSDLLVDSSKFSVNSIVKNYNFEVESFYSSLTTTIYTDDDYFKVVLITYREDDVTELDLDDVKACMKQIEEKHTELISSLLLQNTDDSDD